MTEDNKFRINVSEAALTEIRAQLAKRKTPDAFLRLGVKSGGCSGFSYVLMFEDNVPRDRDFVFTFGDVKVVVDSKSIIYLNGTLLDWEVSLMKRGFKFKNPLQQSECGCGLSFNV